MAEVLHLDDSGDPRYADLLLGEHRCSGGRHRDDHPGSCLLVVLCSGVLVYRKNSCRGSSTILAGQRTG